MKMFIIVVSIIAVLIILNILFGYKYHYGVKTGSSPVLKGPLNDWHQRGGYEFGSNLLVENEWPEGFIITLTHPASDRDSDLGLSHIEILFRVPKEPKYEVVVEDIDLTYKTADGKTIEPMDERVDGSYLTKKDFPLNLNISKGVRNLLWNQTYREQDFSEIMEGYVRIKLLVDGKSKILEGIFNLERVKAYWKPAIWLSR